MFKNIQSIGEDCGEKGNIDPVFRNVNWFIYFRKQNENSSRIQRTIT
jgi:hypothetical protein